MAAITICSDLGSPKNKVCQCFPIYLPWSDGTECHDLSFLIVELLSQLFHSFTSIKRLFSSSLSVIRVVSSAYLLLLLLLSHVSRVQLCATPWTAACQAPVPGILQARILEWVAISFSSAWKWKSESEVTQSCPTLSDPMDCSLPGSSIHGIFQARLLEWGAIAFSSPKAKQTQRFATDNTWLGTQSNKQDLEDKSQNASRHFNTAPF